MRDGLFADIAHSYGKTPGDSVVLSEIGTLHLEFVHLSEITGDKKYAQKVILS